MYFYKLKNEYVFSFNEYSELERCEEYEFKNTDKIIYFLLKMNPNSSRFKFSISDESLLEIERESLELLFKPHESNIIPSWIKNKINNRLVTAINTEYMDWKNKFSVSLIDKWRINILALGDVGGTLLTGLRLIGGEYIKEIGIFDRDENVMKRWEYEMNQVFDPFSNVDYPVVTPISKDNLFDCDMFVFCASKYVPPVGSDIKDVRLIQFEENSKIISEYAKMARDKEFNGIFAVVSDPVDLLCKVALLESNKNNSDEYDFNGLNPEQIVGYGLGVMNARATFYAKKLNLNNYINKGRAYGPHGKELVIINDIENYDEELSNKLTQLTVKANLQIREFGFKPYIAPALSSAALSIISTIAGRWNYSCTYIGGVYFGAKNRHNKSGIELERNNLSQDIKDKLSNSYESLKKLI